MEGSLPPSKLGATPSDDEADFAHAAASGDGGGLRKKGAGVRVWLLLDVTGQAQVVEAGKHSIKRRTGLRTRDLRILDPLLSYPPTVLGREKAIVINLEHIKCIITAQEVLLLNSRDPSVTPFVEKLERRLLRLHHAAKSQEGRVTDNDEDCSNLYDLEELPSRTVSPSNNSGGFPQFQETDEGGKVDGKPGFKNRDRPRVLPFEFIALEACLEAACSCLDNEGRTLEQEANTVLDKLTSKINTLNLEHVRQIKSQLVAITRRAQKVRDELERLLDDDEYMAEMYLTDKMMQQHLNRPSSSLSSLNERDGMNDGVLRSDLDERMPAEISEVPNNYEGDIQNIDTKEHVFGPSNALGRDSHQTHTNTTHCTISKHLDVEVLELLLDAYFVQIDGILNKLSTLREYIDDTEGYFNIMLDNKQNHLLQMGVMLTTAILVVSAFVVVIDIFGMHVKIELFNDEKSRMQEFLWIVGGSAMGSIVLYVIVIVWCKHKRLLG